VQRTEGQNLEVEHAEVQHEKVVSYVVMAEELGSSEADVPKENPLQHLEDNLVQSIKTLKPADVKSEAKVVALMDDYLAASARHSHALRDYVERFLIGTCLGDYYIPFAVRERAADLSGLGNAVVVEHRLKPWEREFLLRFDESEVLEGLFKQANSRNFPAEKSLVHNAHYGKVVMHRLTGNHTRSINRWVQWLDETFGADAGLVHEGFRSRWHKLKQIEPLSPFVFVLFIGLMAVSGVALQALGVPLDQFFQSPVRSMVITTGGLALLSWANFMLVILARPVYREIQNRVVVFVLARFAKPLLLVECVAMVLLIWGSVRSAEVVSAWGSPLVIACGVVFLVLAFISRAGGWLDRLSFPQLALRVGVFYLLFTIVYELLGANNVANSLWLLLGFVVLPLRSRPMMHWAENVTKTMLKGVFAFRLQQSRYSTTGLRVVMALVGVFALAIIFANVTFAKGFISLGLSDGITVTLLCFVALELSLNGGIFTHSGDETSSFYRLGRVAVWVVISLVVIRLPNVLDVGLALQACLAYYLIYAAFKQLAPSKEFVG